MNKNRRNFLGMLALGVAGLALGNTAEAATGFLGFLEQPKPGHRHKLRHHQARRGRKSSYAGAETVNFLSREKPGTIIIKTSERALYRVLGDGKAKRFGVAVGKEGFQWAGVARIGMKRIDPPWTPPPEMIERMPQYAKWADGMPGGLPTNPLGPRAMYLYDHGDTGFRIHGTIHPESIGHAASSGCILMLNREVIELYAVTPVGTKVIVI